MPDKLGWITDEMNALQEQGLKITIRIIGSACGPWMVVDGKQVLNFCTNNYFYHNARCNRQYHIGRCCC